MLQSKTKEINAKDEAEDKEVELNVVVGIPAFNSERVLPKMITSLRGVVDGIIVCDNGSTDSTLKRAKELGCKTVSLARHVSDSAATLSLFEAALETKADVLITVAPGALVETRDIENLAAKIIVDHSEIVVGTNEAIGKSDMERSPIKAFSRNAFSKMFYLQGATLRAARDIGFGISKCQVSWVPRESNKPQKSKPVVVVDSRNKKETQMPKSKTPKKNSGVFTVKGQPLSLSFLFTNIWFLRTALLISGEIISILLLAYSFIFLNTFRTFGNTTSYFPWSWRIAYVSSGAAMNLFWVGIAASIAPLIVFAFVFVKWVMPELRISFDLFKKRMSILS